MLVDKRILAVFALGLMLPALGCATIVDGMHSNVKMESFPPSAHVVVRDRSGKEVASDMTPAIVKLRRGSYVVLPAHYTATIESPGYQPRQVDLKYKFNPWVFGNIVFGGPVGLIIDDATGAMWEPDQTNVAVALEPLPNASQTAMAPGPATVDPNSAVPGSGAVQKVAYNAAAKQTK